MGLYESPVFLSLVACAWTHHWYVWGATYISVIGMLPIIVIVDIIHQTLPFASGIHLGVPLVCVGLNPVLCRKLPSLVVCTWTLTGISGILPYFPFVKHYPLSVVYTWIPHWYVWDATLFFICRALSLSVVYTWTPHWYA